MSNFHTDDWIRGRLLEHKEDVLQDFSSERVVGIFLQGSQNYGLDEEPSDVDSKAIIIPSVNDLIFSKEAISTTYIRNNDEHIDIKDIRVMFNILRKQNISFLEILFTKYFEINPLYASYWDELLKYREEIAHYNQLRAIKCMSGHAYEKYKHLEHRFPSRAVIVDRYGYDPKQLLHLKRIEEYLVRYIQGVPYLDCLIPQNPEYLLDIKSGALSLDAARETAKSAIKHIDDISLEALDIIPNIRSTNVVAEEVLNLTQERIIRRSLELELS